MDGDGAQRERARRRVMRVRRLRQEAQGAASESMPDTQDEPIPATLRSAELPDTGSD